MTPRPMSTTELLEAILEPGEFNHAFYASGISPFCIEAEAVWYPRNEEGTEGEAQATISIANRRYAISLEPLP